jgi:hypothetical protein
MTATHFPGSARRPIPPRPHALDPDVLITPVQPDYDRVRLAWNLSVDQRPAAIGLPRSTDDVVALMRFATEHGLRVAPQATGHQASCLGPLDGSLLLKTGRLREVWVDPGSRIARVQAGAQWLDVTEPAGDHGLATLAGSAPDVGVIGYTLGGGLSWLARRYGLAANSVRRFEVVTADGRQVVVDAEAEPELFWALRGGGGCYAVVTWLEFELYEVAEVYAGAMLWPLERAQEILAAWAEWVSQVPDDLTSVARLLRVPPMPELPPAVSGRDLVAIEAAFIGTARAGRRLLDPLRARRPEIDTFAAIPARALGALHMDPPTPVPATGDGMLLSELATPAIDTLVDLAGPGAPSPLLSLDLRQLGGAMSRGRTDGGAVSGLPAQFALFAVGMTPTPDSVQAVSGHIADLQRALGRWGTPRAFANFSEQRRTPDELFGESAHRRLKAVKRAYDPNDLIVANHPVTPGRTEAGALK